MLFWSVWSIEYMLYDSSPMFFGTIEESSCYHFSFAAFGRPLYDWLMLVFLLINLMLQVLCRSTLKIIYYYLTVGIMHKWLGGYQRYDMLVLVEGFAG